jgi:hypothetical protein
MVTEVATIQWSGGAIAALMFSLVVLLIWLSVMLGARRDRRNKKELARTMPEIEGLFAPGRRYTVHVKALRAFDGLCFVGRHGGEWFEPMQNVLVFAREDGRRVMIRAEQIRFIEQN